MMGELREAQTTPTQEKGKSKEGVIDVDMEEKDDPPSPKPSGGSGILTLVVPVVPVASRLDIMRDDVEIDWAESAILKPMRVLVISC